MPDSQNFVLRLLIDGQWVGVQAIQGPPGESVILDDTVDGAGNAVTGISIFENKLTIQKALTFLTEIVKGSVSGSGNAVTDIDVSGNKVSITKGETFLTEHQDISGLQTKTISDGGGFFDTDTVEGALQETGNGVKTLRTGAAIVDVTASKTLSVTDVGSCQKVVADSLDEVITITIPAGDAIPVQSEIEVLRIGQSGVVFAAESGVTLLSVGNMVEIGEQYGAATLKKLGTNLWHLGGALA